MQVCTYAAIVTLILSNTIFPIASLKAETLTTLYSFTGLDDGAYPTGLTLNRNNLFGTSVQGGKDDSGTVFSIKPNTGSETTIYSFCAQNNCSDGSQPLGGVTDYDGSLFGTTSYTNGSTFGVVFKVDPKTGSETVIHTFTGGADGATPFSSLIYKSGKLYGTTSGGGSGTDCAQEGCGTVFVVDVATGTETILHSFQGGTDGESPAAGLTYANGLLYGVTGFGGGSAVCPGGCGTVFKIDPASGAETVIYSFSGESDGAGPSSAPIYKAGTIYGTTDSCCSTYGNVFSFNTKTSKETTLHTFNTPGDGKDPEGQLIYDKGLLYGTTNDGGSEGSGTIFTVNAKTGSESIIYSFCVQHGCADGAMPKGNLISSKGSFFGTTTHNGTGGYGTVFKFVP
jgi:uncharacterized repeat protein (TIGR03803 family)